LSVNNIRVCNKTSYKRCGHEAFGLPAAASTVVNDDVDDDDEHMTWMTWRATADILYMTASGELVTFIHHMPLSGTTAMTSSSNLACAVYLGF